MQVQATETLIAIGEFQETGKVLATDSAILLGEYHAEAKQAFLQSSTEKPRTRSNWLKLFGSESGRKQKKEAYNGTTRITANLNSPLFS